MSSSLESAAAALQQAAAHRDFGAVEVRAREYGALSRASMAGLPLPEAEARIKDAFQLLESVRRGICAARAQLAKQEKRLKHSARYTAASPIHTWTVQG